MQKKRIAKLVASILICLCVFSCSSVLAIDTSSYVWTGNDYDLSIATNAKVEEGENDSLY